VRRRIRDAFAEQQRGDRLRGLVHCVVAGWEVVDLPLGIGLGVVRATEDDSA
jgi:hypothetical protein